MGRIEFARDIWFYRSGRLDLRANPNRCEPAMSLPKLSRRLLLIAIVAASWAMAAPPVDAKSAIEIAADEISRPINTISPANLSRRNARSAS